MSHELPRCGEVMRAECDDDDECSKLFATSAPLHTFNWKLENKKMLRQQLLAASKKIDTEESKLLKPKNTRNREKNRWNLKFHHQALPQEYLDHYEQSLQKAHSKRDEQRTQVISKLNTESDNKNSKKKSFKIWTQMFTDTENKTDTYMTPQISTALNIANKSCKKMEIKKKSPTTLPSKIVTYEDLPYMGEMTLSNLKPRRGRKPKKADICHLIYENYGTVVPGQPLPQKQHDQTTTSPLFQTNKPASMPKTHLQHKIISSLLERKLLQENNKKMEILKSTKISNPRDSKSKIFVASTGITQSDDEPLNLCLRDLNGLKKQIKKRLGSIYSTIPEVNTEVDTNNPDYDNIKSKQLNAISVIHVSTNLSKNMPKNSDDLLWQHKNISSVSSEPAASAANVDFVKEFPGYMYCSDAGICMTPFGLTSQLLYYQRLAATSQLFLRDDNQNKILLTPIGFSENDLKEPHSHSTEESKNKLVLEQTSDLHDSTPVEDVKYSPNHFKMKRTSSCPPQGPVKRKRSAIFMPPMPIKGSSTTPTTEVSICKFKFTGGSKPSLQEKKMLSVDSGGNYTYYSGTGNKGNKGYEYMLKDSDQRRTTKPVIESLMSALPKIEGHDSISTKENLSVKKRKSKKNSQREKLEQTFKEKGFLIQTQQHQSAEGATYCKFRQLRKFTRYLFRSWKDYLPGELNEKKSKGTSDV